MRVVFIQRKRYVEWMCGNIFLLLKLRWWSVAHVMWGGISLAHSKNIMF